MGTFYLTVTADASFSGGNAPSLQVLIGGVVVSAQSIAAGSNTYTFLIDYSGSYPSSLSLQFDPGSGDPGDTISFSEVRINGQNVTSDLTATILSQGVSSTYNTVAGDYLFGRVEATSGDLGTPTQTGSGNVNGAGQADIINANTSNDRVRGLGGDDAISGGAGNDIIFGEGGNDVIIGEAGDDILLGGDGDDLIYGGTENDTIVGDTGNDILNGGAGNDTLSGDAGNDIVYGEGGDDWVVGGAGNDYLFGDAGNDTMSGGGGNDVMLGGDNNDLMYGGAGADEIYGENGNDYISGGAGADTMFGGAGTDELYGGAGNDQMDGGTENDILNGGAGDDTIDGDAGNDTITGGAGADLIDGGAGNDFIHGNGIDEFAIASILNANPGVVYSTVTGSFYQYVTTAETWDNANAAAQSSTLNGIGGSLANITTAEENAFVTSLVSGATWLGGSDAGSESAWTWTGGLEDGVQFWQGLSGGSLVNNMYASWNTGEPNEYGSGEDYIELQTSGVWNDNGGPSQPTLTRGYVIEWEAGLMADDNAADTLSGGIGNDWIYGYGGNDTLNGDAGYDVLFGMTGSDTLNGGDNDDILFALNGTVNVNGFGATGGNSTVTDYNVSFGSSADGFTYTDGNDPSNVTVTGSHINNDGNLANGALEIDIANTGGSFSSAYGYWSETITFTEDLTNAELHFSYRHRHASQNDNGEDSQVFYNIGSTVFISTGLGSDGTTDTGWVDYTVSLGSVTAGSSITLALGIVHWGSSGNNEDAWVHFDDISVTGDASNVITAGYSTADADANESNILNGGNGNDVLYGSSGNDTLNGDAGVDTLYSGSVDTTTALINSLISGSVFYNSITGNFYQVVSNTLDWSDANTAASGATLNGVSGHLATITSAAEQNFLESLAGGVNTWLGGSDSGSEGVWTWTAGAYESGVQFANSSGGAVNGWYNDWAGGQPNDSNSTQNYLYMLNGGSWADMVVEGDGSTGFVTVGQYAIEWEGADVFAALNTTTLNGGAGNDELYGSDGIDIFVFDNLTSVDNVYNFNTLGRDKLDISSILSYDPLSNDIADFVQLTESSGNTTVSVDANGSAGGSSYTAVAVLNGVTGLDVHELLSGDNLIV